MSARLIGLTGMAGAGKDEAAKALVAAGWSREAFADRMRTAILALDPIVDYDVDGLDYGHADITPNRLSEIVQALGWDGAKRTYDEVRRLLQRFGTEAGREIHGENCWVDALLRDWNRAERLVVTDVRFPNEAEAIQRHNGLVVKILRPGLAPLPGGHASEAGIPDELVDAWILNDGTVSRLHELVMRIARGEVDRG